MKRLAVALLALFLVLSVSPAFASAYLPGVKPGATASWKLDHYDNATSASLAVTGVSGGNVAGVLRLVPETGSPVEQNVSISMAGTPPPTIEKVWVRVAQLAQKSLVLNVTSSGVVSYSDAQNLTVSNVMNGAAGFSHSQQNYTLSFAVVPSAGGSSFLVTADLVWYVYCSVTVTGSSAPVRGAHGTYGATCGRIDYGSQSLSLTDAVGSAGFVSFPDLTSVPGGILGISLPPLVIAANLTVGDQISPRFPLSIKAESSQIFLNALRDTVSTSVGYGSETLTYTWDRATGILLSYSESGNVVQGVTITSTSAFSPTPNSLAVMLYAVGGDAWAVFFGQYWGMTWSVIFAYLAMFTALQSRDYLRNNKVPAKYRAVLYAALFFVMIGIIVFAFTMFLGAIL